VAEKTAEHPAPEPRSPTEPGAPPAVTQTAAAASAAAPASPLFPTEPLRVLDVDGRLRVAELKVARLAFADTSLEIRAKDGSLVSTTRSRVYQAELRAALASTCARQPGSPWSNKRRASGGPARD
jgi:hypothetical protein